MDSREMSRAPSLARDLELVLLEGMEIVANEGKRVKGEIEWRIKRYGIW